MRPCGSHASLPLLSFPCTEHSQLSHHIPLLPFHVVFVLLFVCFMLLVITLRVHILILVLRNFLESNRLFTLRMDSDVRDCFIGPN